VAAAAPPADERLQRLQATDPASVEKRLAAGRWATAAKANHGQLEAQADGNGNKGSENNSNEGNKESEGDKGKGNKGNDGNFPIGGEIQWSTSSGKNTQQ
jgi:hypothetical protein